MPDSSSITAFINSPAFSELDRHFARFTETLAGGDNPQLALAAAMVSWKRGQGHICLDLQEAAGAEFAPEPGTAMACPPLEEWTATLRASSVVGRPGEFFPLILDDQSRLYLHRYWEYEARLAEQVRFRSTDAKYDPDRLRDGLERLFPAGAEDSLDWQKVAAFTAVAKRICVISGGPGTGKTSTVLKILALLLEQVEFGKLRIALAAPTGKAASRLQDSIKQAREQLCCAEEIKALLPESAKTLHRLLGWQESSPYFRHNEGNPLPVDVVVVDEASMVDLALMAKLFQAVPAKARVILLGDKDQLASVEAGAVLGDICSGASNGFSPGFCERYSAIAPERLPPSSTSPALADCIVQLQKNYRFGESSGIFRLSQQVKEGRTPEALESLRSGAAPEISWNPAPEARRLGTALRDVAVEGFRAYLEAPTPEVALERFSRFRVLAALRHGPFGVENLNLLIESLLEETRLIQPAGRWYRGRPVMVTRNDYNVHLFNGDIGIIFPDAESGEPRAFFAGPDNTLRKILPLRLPEHETVYAMTVHKSQGSEFEDVLLILPDRDNPVLTRELVYTGLTRARHAVRLWSGEEVLRTAIGRSTRRVSGLQEALWPGNPGAGTNE